MGIALAVFAAVAFILVRERALKRWILIGIIGVGVSATGFQLRAENLDSAQFQGTYLAQAAVTGDISARSSKVVGQSYFAPSALLPIRIERLRNAQQTIRLRLPARVELPAESREYVPGSRIELTVRFVKRLGQFWLVHATSDPVLLKRSGPISRAAQALRIGLRQAATHLPQPAGGLLPGLVVGDTSSLDGELASAMRNTNLTHLTAVSGANLALVAAFVVAALRLVGVRRRLLPWITALSIAGFVVVARPDPSVLRAAVMAAVLIVATALELPGLGLSALMVAVLLLILFDPSQAQRPGFILSVLATAGLLFFASPWARRLQGYMPRWLAISLAVPLAAQALCTPYLVLISGQFSLIGLWTNLLVAPAIAPCTILGFIAALTSPVFPMGAALLAWLSFLPLWWITLVARVGASLPFANIRWQSGWFGVLLSAVIIVIAYYLARRSPRLLVSIYVALLLLIASLRAFSPMWPMNNWSLAMCDVGQGDGLVVRTSTDSAIVIDAGPDPTVIDSCLHELGINAIPLVILTHNHADHVEGLPGVLRHRTVGQIWLSPEMEPVFESKRISGWVKGINVVSVPVYQRMRFEMVEIEAIWPRESIHEGSVPNNASIVIVARWPDHAALLLGDVEVQAQQLLQIRGPIDIVKIAHHGSANQDFELLKKLDPQVALISVGAVNPYGHPSAKTLRALNLAGSAIFRSDRDGSVALALKADQISVAARGHPWWRK